MDRQTNIYFLKLISAYLLFLLLEFGAVFTQSPKIQSKVFEKNSILSHPTSFGLFKLNLFVAGGISINVNTFGLDKEVQEIQNAFLNFIRSSEIDNGSTYFSSPYALSADFEGLIQYNIHTFPYIFIRVGFTASMMFPQNYVLRIKQIGPFPTPFEVGISFSGSILSVPILIGMEYTIKPSSFYAGFGFVYQHASLKVIENGLRTGNKTLGDAGEIFVSTDVETKTSFSGTGLGLQFLLGTKVRIWSHLSVFLEMKFTFSGAPVSAIRQTPNPLEADIEGATKTFKDAQNDAPSDFVIDRETDKDILNVLEIFPLGPYESRSQSEEAPLFLLLDTRSIHWRIGVGYAF